MKHSFGRAEKIRLILDILMLVLIVHVITWLEPGMIKEQLFAGLSRSADNVVIHVLQQSNLKLSYAVEDNQSVMEKLAESINNNNTVYRFVEQRYTEQNLVIYDPNQKSIDNITIAENVEQKESATVRKKKTLDASEKSDGDIGRATTKAEENAVQETFVPTFSVSQICDYDFLRSNLYIVPERASVLPEDLDGTELLSMNMSIKKDASVPQILIYHTHGSETFADSTGNLKETGIIAVGAKLAQILSEEYGYNVIHCTEIFDNVGGVFDRSKAYDYSREAVQQILMDNPTIEVIIDLHRDGVSADTHLVTEIDGKKTAQIMFFNGVSRSSTMGEIDYLYNQYRKDNLSFSLQAKLEAMGKYPEFTRKNYVDAYQYNLDLLPRAMLIEAGAQNNTLQEELNAMEPLADILDGVLSGESRKHLGLEE